MTLSICGSATFIKEMVELQKQLEVFGFEVHTPLENGIDNLNRSIPVTPQMQGDATRVSYKLIGESEGILVANYLKNGIEGYIGGNTLIEMGYAFAGNKDIFLLNPIPDVPYRAEIKAMQPVVLNGDLSKIQEYYQSLPVVYVSSENILKKKAVSLGFRKFNHIVRVIGHKTNSGVSEQPLTVDETYRGAIGRLNDLKKIVSNNSDVQYRYLASIEGGMVTLLDELGYFNVYVCVLESYQGKRRVTINTNLEFPKEMTDLIPSQYPDLGVLAQKKYGQTLKDPFIIFTGGKISRLDLMKNDVANTLGLFEYR